MGPDQMIQDNLEVYNLNHICKIPLAMYGNISEGSGELGCGHLWETIVLPTI